MSRLDDLILEIKTQLKTASDITQKAEGEDRDFTDEEREQVTAAITRASELKKDVTKLKGDDALRKAMRDLGDEIGLVDADAAKADRRRQAADTAARRFDEAKSLGELFVTSEEYDELLKLAPGGEFGKKQRVSSRPVVVDHIVRKRRAGVLGKSLVTGTGEDSGGALSTEDYRGLLVGPEAFMRPLRLRDLVTPGETDNDQIDYARILGVTNNAAVVPEAVTAAAVGSGNPAVTAAQAGVKPESGFTTVRVSTTVKTIANWMPATKRALSDRAQVRTLIDAFLESFLEEELEDQMVTGDGTGDNFEGVADTSGTIVQARVPDPAGAPPGLGKLLTLRRAKTKVRLASRSAANGYLMHPTDLEGLEELVDNEGRFYGDGPFSQGSDGTTYLWKLPVIESEAATVGAPWCANWFRAILWDREQATIVATDSHMDFFVRNLVAILAEMRAAFGVIQPSAFCQADITDDEG
jgi:hypothetical protein